MTEGELMNKTEKRLFDKAALAAFSALTSATPLSAKACATRA